MNAPRYITTSAGVRIGCAYQRPAPRPSRDQERVQAALLERRTAKPMTLLERLALALWRWC